MNARWRMNQLLIWSIYMYDISADLVLISFWLVHCTDDQLKDKLIGINDESSTQEDSMWLHVPLFSYSIKDIKM